MDDKTREFLDKNKDMVLEARKIREDKSVNQRAKQLYSSAKNNSAIINDLLFSRVLESFMKQYYDDKDILILYTYGIFTEEEISKLQKSTLDHRIFSKYKNDGYDEKFCSKGEEINYIEIYDADYYIPFIYEKELYESLGIELGHWFYESLSFFADKEDFENIIKELESSKINKYKDSALKAILEVSKFFNERDRIENEFHALSKHNANLVLLEIYKQILELYRDNNLGEDDTYKIRLDYKEYINADDSFRKVYSNKILKDYLRLNCQYYKFVDFYKYDNGKTVTYLPIMYSDLFGSNEVLKTYSCGEYMEVYVNQQDLENLILGVDETNERKLKR